MKRCLQGRSLHRRAPFLFLAISLHAAGPCESGTAAASAGRVAEAEKLLAHCVAAGPAPIQAYLALSGIYQSQGKDDTLAELALQALKRYPSEKRFYQVAGIHAGRTRRFERAVEVLGAAYKRWPEDQQIARLYQSAELGRGQELLDAGANEQAVNHLARAVELNPADVDAQLNLGRALHNLHRNTEALEVFERLMRINPPPPLAHFHRGLSYHTLGQFDRAVADLTEELKLNPEYAEARLVRGLAYMSSGDLEHALDDLEAAAQLMPKSAHAQYAYGRCLLQAGNREAAEEPLRRTMELDPTDPAPVNALVAVLIRTGRAQEARPLARKAAGLSRERRSAAPGEIVFESLRRPRP